jgi:hypothetical protein
LGEGHDVVGIGSDVKKKFVDRCFKIGRKQQHVVDELILAWLSEKVNDKDVKVASLVNTGTDSIRKIDRVKELFDKIQFYDGYSESNEEKVLTKLREAGTTDKEYTERLRRVYALGRKEIETAEEAIDEALAILEGEGGQESGEVAPKLGHPPKYLQQKKEPCQHDFKYSYGTGERTTYECTKCGVRTLGRALGVVEKPKQLGHKPRFKREPTLEELARRKYGER